MGRAGGGFTPQQVLLSTPRKGKGCFFRDILSAQVSEWETDCSKGCPSTSSIGVSPVGKPPDVSKAHAVSDAGEEEIQAPCPVPSVFWALRAQVPILTAGAYQEIWSHWLSEGPGYGRGQTGVEQGIKTENEEWERGKKCQEFTSAFVTPSHSIDTCPLGTLCPSSSLFPTSANALLCP